MLSNWKMVMSNNVIEFYYFEKPLNYGSRRPSSQPDQSRIGTKNNTPSNRKLSIYRAKRTLKRIINSNARTYKDSNGEILTYKFITFTFKENIQDIPTANYYFKKFIQRFNYHIYQKKISKLKYVNVIEFQKRGAIHYHSIFFNLPYTPAVIINKIWAKEKAGGIKINKINKIKNVGSYVCKYMVKELNDPRLCGKKAYSTSQLLLKPKVLADQKLVPLLKDLIGDSYKLYQKTFHHDYCGDFEYSMYNIMDNPILKQQLLAILKL